MIISPIRVALLFYEVLDLFFGKIFQNQMQCSALFNLFDLKWLHALEWFWTDLSRWSDWRALTQ